MKNRGSELPRGVGINAVEGLLRSAVQFEPETQPPDDLAFRALGRQAIVRRRVRLTWSFAATGLAIVCVTVVTRAMLGGPSHTPTITYFPRLPVEHRLTVPNMPVAASHIVSPPASERRVRGATAVTAPVKRFVASTRSARRPHRSASRQLPRAVWVDEDVSREENGAVVPALIVHTSDDGQTYATPVYLDVPAFGPETGADEPLASPNLNTHPKE